MCQDTHIGHRQTAAEATYMSARGIDPNEVLYQIVAEDVLGVLEDYNECREESGESPIVLSRDQIRKIGDDLGGDWHDSVYEQIDEIARMSQKGEKP